MVLRVTVFIIMGITTFLFVFYFDYFQEFWKPNMIHPKIRHYSEKYKKSWKLNVTVTYPKLYSIGHDVTHPNVSQDNTSQHNINQDNVSQDNINQINKRHIKTKPLKRILFYTPFFGDIPWGYHIRPLTKSSRMCGCEWDHCEVTYDHNKMSVSDLVFFHARDMPDIRKIAHMRTKNQLWVYFVRENPFHAPGVSQLDRYFNLTASYRTSSDIYCPSGSYTHVRQFDRNQNRTLSRNYAKGKTRQIAWAVSNCGQPRDRLAKKLHQFGLQIDNFGGCKRPYLNSRRFSRDQKAPYNEYKFVFAAENRLCKDYVTEKYWDHSFEEGVNTIPIVLGGSNYSDPRIAIPGSFIDAMQFPSPKKLAEYLLLLDKNDTLYNEYFEWKKSWRRVSEKCTYVNWYCDMCRKLHDGKWNLRAKPLTSTIGTRKECDPYETTFDNWIDRN